MKVVTFLGTSVYNEITYVWGDRQRRTQFFPEALGRWLQPTEMLVALTQEAKAHENWSRLQQRLASCTDLVPIDIPTGRSEKELWEIFRALTARFHAKDELAFDITHAFRSLPVVSLLAAAYLQAAQQVRLCYLLYGAYEARQNGVAPVFDLTAFLELFQWLTACDVFVRAGDARRLAELVDEAHQRPWATQAANRHQLPHHLHRLSTRLRTLSQALLLARPKEVAQAASGLGQNLAEVAEEAEHWAHPFAVLLQNITDTYAHFASDTLATQRLLIKWYLERGHLFPAVQLAREWLVSCACAHLGKHVIDDRDAVERALNAAAGRTQRSELPDQLQSLADALRRLLVRHWMAVGDLRNDIAHCGFRKQPRSVRIIVKQAGELARQLDELPLTEESRA